MGAWNYATKYSNLVDEKFKLGLLTHIAVNNNYDWNGVDTVKVYKYPTVTPGNYRKTGSNRYGTPDELGNDVETLQLSQDKAFTYTIDRAAYDDTMMTAEVGASLAREIDLEIIPMIDKYRLSKMAAADSSKNTTAITKSNAYELFLALTERLNDAKVPVVGRVAFISSTVYKYLKLDPSFVKTSDLGQQIAIRGQVGQVDGVNIILTPTSYFPANTDIIITHNIATVAPVKLESYKVHEDAPGINGWLVEGRIRHDAFVLANKADAIATHGSAAQETATHGSAAQETATQESP